MGHIGATLTWSGRAIDVDHIESELARLRYEAAGEPSGGHGFAIRTSLLNLVVYAEDEESVRAAGQTILRLSGHHPSRTLLVTARPGGGEARIDARLAAHCHIAAGLEQQVCCEEVTLAIAGPAADHLHSIVVPLLVPDLPVYVWWDAPLPADTHVFEEMMESADRLIVDSAQLAGPGPALAGIAALRRIPGRGAGDLNWQRLDTWCRVAARHLGAAPLNHLLGDVTRIEAGYAGGAGEAPSAQAYLLLGWLARRLGWDTTNAAGAEPGTASVPRGRLQAVIAATAAAHEGIEPGWLTSIEISFGADGEDARVLIRRPEDPLHLTITVAEPQGAMEESVVIEACARDEMLARELEQTARDTEYEAALDATLPLIAAMNPAPSPA